MPDSKKFNLNYRPASYWGPQPLTTHFGTKIKGELRRQAALQSLYEPVSDPCLLSESLTDEQRSAVSAVHPALMGGEYLPDLGPKEVEIARVVMKSTLMDVISIRARRTKHQIIYRIVDEDDGRYVKYEVKPRTSLKPLMFRQLIAMMDGAVEGGLVGGGRDWNFREAGGDPKEYFDFEKASSHFYPQLAPWYDDANAEWLAEKIRERQDEEGE